jgi:HSP20 family protein
VFKTTIKYLNNMSTITQPETRADQRPAAETNRRFVRPEVNIFETADGYVLQAELPGVNKAGLEITVEGTELVITGRRQPADLQAALVYRESPAADYRRAFELDPAIDTARIDAKLDQGVLTLNLPKSERVKPRKVTVDD